jgi:hypothetical protein
MKETFGPLLETKVRLLWDERALYVAFECATKDAWTRALAHDGFKLGLQEPETPAVTVALDTDAAEHAYFRFDVTPGNVTRDMYVYLPELPQWSPAPTTLDRVELVTWESPHLETAVSLRGELETTTTPEEADKARAKPPSEGFTVEMAIPWRDMVGNAIKSGAPTAGAKLRANFARVEPYRPLHWHTPVANMAWSTRLYDRPSFFGELELVEK